MGITIRADRLASGRIMKPIIYTARVNGVTDNKVSLNRSLAERLIKISSPRQRGMRMGQVLLDCIKNQPDNILIADIDAMFKPDYPIDVLKVLIEACRAKPFQVFWPGSYEDGTLIYSVPGMPDYKTYKIENYDVTVII